MLYIILAVLVIACAGIIGLINMLYPLREGQMLITKNQKHLANAIDALLTSIKEELKEGK